MGGKGGLIHEVLLRKEAGFDVLLVQVLSHYYL